jgi:molybdopterin converting factor small subunit
VAKVTVTNYGSVRIEAGWYCKEVEVAQGTLEDVLSSLEISGGGTLYDLLVEGNTVKPAYTLLFNGLNLQSREGLKTQVKTGDNIVAVDVFHMAAGG